MDDLLQAAIRQHRSGQLREAAQAYQDILARNPNHPDALHLLGVVAYQFGQHQQATQLIGRAIALHPNAASFHANLGEVWRTVGEFDRAIESCRAALRLQPDYPEAINNLGVALLARGDVDAAAEQFRSAIALRPDFALAYNNLGNALRMQGDLDGAMSYFRQAIERDPRQAEAHTNLGQMLCEVNELREAFQHCREAVRLRPNYPEALSNLGNVLRARGQLDEAKAHYAEALRVNPSIGMLHNNMAQALQEEGKFEEALNWYQQALQRDPNTARIHCNLASCLGEMDRYEEAIARYHVALRLDPNSAEAQNGIAFVRQEQGLDEQALKHYREAIRLKPSHAPAHSNLGTLLEELNDLKGAEAAFREAIRHEPMQAGAHGQLAILLRGKLPDEDLAAIHRLLEDPDLTDNKRATLRFGLAQVLDARGNHAEAAEQLRQANGMSLTYWTRRGQGYDAAAHTGFVSSMMAACTPEFFARLRGAGSESERPVFIFGLPRSGTTLLEQILASHSQVHGAGELRFAREDFESLPAILYSEEPAMNCLPRLDPEAVQLVTRRHLNRLHELDSTASRIVDKMPDNYLYLGLLSVLFPRAKFIHCRRDLRDVAVSCWITNFRSIRWASDPELIAHRFREYRRIMDYWRTVLPVPLLEIDYEETVTDLEGVARRLVEFCGLEWEPACLAFHESNRPVRTASVTQVRQPVYKRSVARWKNYEAALGPLFAQLAPLMETSNG